MNELKEISAEEYAVSQVQHFQGKADRNKFESIWSFRIIMLCTLFAPLFVSLGEGFWLSKVIPSTLSVIAAFSTAWIQLRKPHELWSIYRTAQRRIEEVITHYQFKLHEYKELNDLQKEAKLVSEVCNITIETHKNWTQKVPNPDELKVTENKK